MRRRRPTRSRQAEFNLRTRAPSAAAKASDGGAAADRVRARPVRADPSAPGPGGVGAGRARVRTPVPETPVPQTQILEDVACSILERAGHPDLGFHARVDPYHGTADVAAGPAGAVHRVRARVDAPDLLHAELTRPVWKPQTVVLGGAADPYPAVERRLGLSRGCLRVFAQVHHPVAVVTASQLVLRDLDVLRDLARDGCVLVAFSLGTLDAQRARRLEVGASAPAARLHAIHRLAAAGVPVGVLIAPVVPGLTDEDVPMLLEAAAGAGATFARHGATTLPRANAMPLVPDTRPPTSDRRVAREARAQRFEDAFRRAARHAHLSITLPRLSTDAFRAPAADHLALF